MDLVLEMWKVEDFWFVREGREGRSGRRWKKRFFGSGVLLICPTTNRRKRHRGAHCNDSDKAIARQARLP